MPTRQEVCSATAKRLRAATDRLRSIRAVIGMDGFVDSIIDVVDTRDGFERYARMETIDLFGRKIVNAAGKSANYEFVVKHKRLGGNGTIMANALAIAGLDIDYIGSVGVPVPDPVFADFAARVRIHSLCEPGYTDALEFADGKLLLGKIAHLSQVSWEALLQRVGMPKFVAMCEAADLIAMNNWTMLPMLGDIWHHVAVDVLPNLPKRRRRIYIDLADPEKRTPQDLCRGLGTLSAMQKYADVTLGLNLKEAGQVAHVLGMHSPADDPCQIQKAAAAIREKLRLDTIVIHPRGGAGAASDSRTAWFDGPLVKQPRLSTGAGDNFNAGFCLGQLAGGSLEECLCCGVATSGYFVRNAGSPALADLAAFVHDLPVPE